MVRADFMCKARYKFHDSTMNFPKHPRRQTSSSVPVSLVAATKGPLTCLRGAFPPVDFRAVCLVRAMVLLLLLVSASTRCWFFWCVACWFVAKQSHVWKQY